MWAERSRSAGAPQPEPSEIHTRHSLGLEQFFTCIKGEAGLTLLDLGGANQDNVDFITQLGHKLYTQDLARAARQSASLESPPFHAAQIEAFLDENLGFGDGHFDGALVWDTLESLDGALLAATVERLRRIVKPRGYLFTIFHTQEKSDTAPLYGFRIRDARTLLLSERGRQKRVHVFNNRNLERLFQGFDSVKFFLTRDHLREVIVKR
ncbi:MAG: methyltransferase domain-containing protein [Bryobacteraceae bacterium]